ncbi:MAG: hypothetical protein NC201_03435 [Prevotella sp.]|nr:hypothetical protein [Bacteroides sp.]MCM1366280.1 hypothetical protein [Prevotella sp.]MCM1436316.1 hypothetical protein [Prevotella sp.]
MSKLPPDINDDEIRIISSNTTNGSTQPPRRKRNIVLIVFSVIVAVVTFCLLFFFFKSAGKIDHQNEPAEFSGSNLEINNISVESTSNIDSLSHARKNVKRYVVINDTIIRDKKFLIYNPINATPKLHVGDDILNDSTAVLVAQAAGIRRDNGQIVGAFVLKGELLSKGQAKSGYCAIIGGKINLGVAEATPLLEQALESNGYFFRQYPLVVSNQVVENKPQNNSQRKALAELNGNVVVIMSQDRLSFHEFSQTLVDMGVSNAIYLIGSTAYGFAKDIGGRKIEFGKVVENASPNTNYIVWY